MLDGWASAGALSPLMLWIWGSVLVYALATNAQWLVKGSWRSPYRQWLAQVGRFLFYLVIPYLVLGGWPRRPYQGLLSLEDMGIVGLGGRWPVTRWLEAVGVGLGVGLTALLILILAWVNANRRGTRVRLRFSARPVWVILVEALYLEVHWAFYRSALAMTWGNVYTGVFLGLGLVYLEWSLNPFWRQGWRDESQAATRWLRAALALVIALLFLLSRNLWICLVVHWLLELSLRRLGRERVHRPSAQSLEAS